MYARTLANQDKTKIPGLGTESPVYVNNYTLETGSTST